MIVKIRRPGIDHHRVRPATACPSRGDGGRRCRRSGPHRPQQLVRELARSLKQELDLAAECHNAERMAKNLAALPTS